MRGQFLLAQSIDYLAAGILLSISHDVTFLFGRWFGYIFISASLILISTLIISRFNIQILSKLADPLDSILANALTAILIIAPLIAVADEKQLIKTIETPVFQWSGEASLDAIGGIIVVWLILYILLMAIILVFLVIKTSKKHEWIKPNIFLKSAIEESPWIFVLVAIIFFVAGIIANLTKAFNFGYFWEPALWSLCISGIFKLMALHTEKENIQIVIIISIGVLIMIIGVIYIGSMIFDPRSFKILI